MNLTITPVNVNSTLPHQNNNSHQTQNQNFGALQAQFKPQTRIPREADIILDKFLFHFENIAKRIGLDTQKLENKGIKLCLDSSKTEDMDLGILKGVIKNKDGNVVKNNGKTLDLTITDFSEKECAESLANTIKKLDIAA